MFHIEVVLSDHIALGVFLIATTHLMDDLQNINKLASALLLFIKVPN
jgi:hypothetical protein